MTLIKTKLLSISIVLSSIVNLKTKERDLLQIVSRPHKRQEGALSDIEEVERATFKGVMTIIINFDRIAVNTEHCWSFGAWKLLLRLSRSDFYIDIVAVYVRALSFVNGG